jgi:hypothetical protein
LSVSFCFNFKLIFAQKFFRTTNVYCVALEKNSSSSILSIEENVQEYAFMLGMIKQEYGENSEQYKFMIPYTAKFRAWYGFPFPLSGYVNNSGETHKLYIK